MKTKCFTVKDEYDLIAKVPYKSTLFFKLIIPMRFCNMRVSFSPASV